MKVWVVTRDESYPQAEEVVAVFGSLDGAESYIQSRRMEKDAMVWRYYIQEHEVME